MSVRYLRTIVLVVAVFVASVASGQSQVNLQQRVSIDVNAVSPRQVLDMIARALGCTVVVDPKVAAPVTIRVSKVTARTALNAVCESVGCRWHLDGTTLHIDVEQPGPPQPSGNADKQAKPRLSEPLPSGEPVYVPGNGVTPPVLQQEVRPQYTPAAMKAKLQGQVDLEIVVLRDGTVTDVHLLRSLAPELDEQAIKAMGEWRFAPAQLNGKPVAARCQVQMVFSLRGKQE